MVGLQLTNCNHESGCKTAPIFGYPDDLKASRCLIHKESEMIDIFNVKCEFPGCTKQRTHNFIKFEGNDNIEHKKHRPRFCGEHKEPGMVNVLVKMCEFTGCVTIPTFGYPGVLPSVRCSKHKENGMVQQASNNFCNYDGCTKRASFNIKGCKPAIRCLTHKDENMVNVEMGKCIVETCDNLAKFKIINTGKRGNTHCWTHTLEERLKLVNKGEMTRDDAYKRYNSSSISKVVTGNESLHKSRCIHILDDRTLCLNKAIYNIPENDKPEYCFAHKTSKMHSKIDKRLCKYKFNEIDGDRQCTTRGTFALCDKDGKFGELFCNEHKKPGMISVDTYRKSCKFQVKLSLATKIVESLSNANDDFITVDLSKMDDDEMKNIIRFGEMATKFITFTKSNENALDIKVKESIDIDKNEDIDVLQNESKSSPIVDESVVKQIEVLEETKVVKPKRVHNKVKDLIIIPELDNYPSDHPLFENRNINVGKCRISKKEFTIFNETVLDDKESIIPDKKKEFIKPSVTINGIPKPCSISTIARIYKVKEVEFERTSPVDAPRIEVRHKLCRTDGCGMPAHVKHDDYCQFCAIEFDPNNINSIARKSKEVTVVEEMKKRFNTVPWISDRTIVGGTSSRRPDLYVDLIDRVICIEIDENQHVRYTADLENKRVDEIHRDVQDRELIFIRFNPDAYYKGGRKIDSCWKKVNKSDPVKYAVMKSHVNDWNERLKYLEDRIRYYLDLNNVVEESVVVEKLFFDGA
jgi:hypothetical protein